METFEENIKNLAYAVSGVCSENIIKQYHDHDKYHSYYLTKEGFDKIYEILKDSIAVLIY